MTSSGSNLNQFRPNNPDWNRRPDPGWNQENGKWGKDPWEVMTNRSSMTHRI